MISAAGCIRFKGPRLSPHLNDAVHAIRTNPFFGHFPATGGRKFIQHVGWCSGSLNKHCPLPKMSVLLGPVTIQPHTFFPEKPGIHFFQILRKQRTESHVRDDVPFHIHARCNFGQFETLLRHFEHCTLGDKNDLLPALDGISAVEGNFTDCGNEFQESSFTQDLDFSVADLRLETT